MKKECFPTRVHICYPPDEPEPVAYAAEELARYLARAGVAVGDGETYTLCLKTGGEELPDGAYTIRCGEDRTEIVSGEACGIVYGAYGFLERLGFDFLAPDCDVIPEELVLPVGSYTERPAFSARELFWREAMDGAFAVRLKLNSARSSITPRQGGKLMFYNFSHTFNTLVPVEKWFDTHPEYFSEHDGKRLRERTQLCLTNPEVLRLCIEGVEGWIAERPDCRVFSVSMNDWYQPCECASCRKIDREEGSHAGTMIRFVNAVAEAVEERHPGVMIHTFAYLYCRKPPKHVRPRDNVIVRLCSIECCYSHPLDACGCETGPIDVQYTAARQFGGDPHGESAFMKDLKGWSRICDNLFIWDYTTNYANYLQPFPNIHVLAENLRAFRRFGVKGVLEQGNFSQGRVSALGDLKVYLLGKLLWNPDLDAETLVREYAEGAWGKAAEPMLRYIRLMQDAASRHHMGIYDPPDAGYLNEDTLRQAEAVFAEALESAEGVCRERVEREALSIRYVRLAQEAPDAPGHGERVDAFAADARRLGIAELFERRDLEGSFEVLKTSRLTKDRSAAKPIRYPF